MKHFLLLLLTSLLLMSCSQQSDENIQLQKRISDLQKQLAGAYHPGLGEFMSSIQVHHEKLFFAGQKQNWKLADFEIKEIEESIDDISRYCSERSETKSLNIIQPAMNAVSNAIMKADASLFRSSFTELTDACNSCHRATDHAFNVIKVPSATSFSNQNFEPGN